MGCYRTAYGKAYYIKNRQQILATKKEKVRILRPHLMERYGITPEQYDAMFYEQGGGCAICGREDSGRKNHKLLCVDHDHKTGKVRGLLCDECNNGLGRFQDDPELLMAAINYLQQQAMEQSDAS